MAVHVTLEERSHTILSYSDLAEERQEAVAALQDIDLRYEREREGSRPGLARSTQKTDCSLASMRDG